MARLTMHRLFPLIFQMLMLYILTRTLAEGRKGRQIIFAGGQIAFRAICLQMKFNQVNYQGAVPLRIPIMFLRGIILRE